MTDTRTPKHIGDVTFKINPDALTEIISTGRLSEFAAVAAAQAASQISAQIVDHVAAAALDPKKLASAAEIGFSYVVLEGGDYATPGPKGPLGPHPHGGVLVLQSFTQRTA
jgi:hypothetical protein